MDKLETELLENISLHKPTVSIIVPVYNAQEHLAETIDCILAQTFPDFELICIDDGSTDSTPDIIAAYAKSDPRIRCINGGHNGASAARNLGLQQATGTFLWFSDADDIIEPNLLERCVDTAISTKSDVVLFYFDIFDEMKNTIEPYEWIIDRNTVPMGTAFHFSEVKNCFGSVAGFTVNKFYRTAFLRELGVSYPIIGAHEDMPFSCIALASANQVFCLDETPYHYRRVMGQGITNNARLRYRPMLEALKILKNELMGRNLWDTYSKDFSNYAAYMICWKFSELSGQYAIDYDREIRETWLHEFGLDIMPRDEYYNVNDFYFLRELEEVPYFERRENEIDSIISGLIAEKNITIACLKHKTIRKLKKMLNSH